MKLFVNAALASLLAVSVPAFAQEPICGDVNDSGAVTASDALLVLRGAVGQDVPLPCAGYGTTIETCTTGLDTCVSGYASCEGDLSTCSSDLLLSDASLDQCNTDV